MDAVEPSPLRTGKHMRTLITEFISLDGVVQAPGAPSEFFMARCATHEG
jgi:hypothetical protein